MAQVTLSGTVCCKQGDPAVTLKKLGNDYTVAEFSIRDTEYFYYKGDDKPGQFYKVQVGGKAAEFLPDRLERGDFVSVTGQLVQREYNGRTFLDVKDARVNQPYKERNTGGGDAF
jgi:single-stranded DNA-binding protein